MNLEVELIAGVIKGGSPPAHLPAPRLIKIFIASERDGRFQKFRNFNEFHSQYEVYEINIKFITRCLLIFYH